LKSLSLLNTPFISTKDDASDTGERKKKNEWQQAFHSGILALLWHAFFF
jgi:hypothetical protein